MSDDTDARLSALEARVEAINERLVAAVDVLTAVLNTVEGMRPDAEPEPPADPMPLVTCPPEVLTQRFNAVDGEGNRTTISAEEFADAQLDNVRQVVAALDLVDVPRLQWAPYLAFRYYMADVPKEDPQHLEARILAWLWHNSRRSAAMVPGEGTDDVYGHRTWLAYFQRAEAAIRERMEASDGTT